MSLEDLSRGFLFLDTTKSWLYSDLFTAIFLISPASRDFSSDCRMCDEIWLRYVVLGAPGRWFHPWFINDKWVGGFVCRHADTLTCELKLALAYRLVKWYLTSKLVQVYIVYNRVKIYKIPIFKHRTVYSTPCKIFLYTLWSKYAGSPGIR